jgi:hypothetical protein
MATAAVLREYGLMPSENSSLAAGENTTLAAVRRRSLTYLGYLFWVFLAAGALVVVNAAISLLTRWVELLEFSRGVLGLAKPVIGPDIYLLSGIAAAVLAAGALLAFLYSRYRAAWNSRVPAGAKHSRILRIRDNVSDGELAARTEYINEIGKPLSLRPNDDSRAFYKGAAEDVLKHIEPDIAQRAITAGLVVGLNRNPLIDGLTIVASALELQFHVLTRLGKRPSPRVWMEMLRRTGASLFLNSYVTREDTIYLGLAIRKAAWGLGATADAADHAANALHDVAWDDVLGGHSIPGVSAAASLASLSLGAGAFGLRQIGNFVNATADDLLQGVLAGGILYYHGMALAADCLALDREHRSSPEMTRTVSQAMMTACAPAGRLLRDQTRRMREFLAEKRRQAVRAAKESALGGVRSASASLVEKVRSAFSGPAADS